MKEGEEALQVIEISLQFTVKTTVRQSVFLWTHEESDPCWNRFAGKTWEPGGDLCWSSLFLKNYTPWKSSGRTLAHRKDSQWKRSRSTVSHRKDPTLEQGKSVRSPLPKEKGRAEVCDELTDCNPHSMSHCADGGAEVEKISSEVKPKKKGEVRGRCFKICFYFSLL